MDLSEAKQRLLKYFEEACDVMLFKIKGIAFQFERIGEGRFYNLDFFFEFEANNLVVNEDILETDAKNDDDYDLRQDMYLAARLFYQDFQIVYYNNHKPILESEDTIKLWIENKEKQILYTNATNYFDFHNQPLHIDGELQRIKDEAASDLDKLKTAISRDVAILDTFTKSFNKTIEENRMSIISKFNEAGKHGMLHPIKADEKTIKDVTPDKNQVACMN